MQGQVIIVTGAAGNLGRAVVKRLAADGVHVVAVDRETAPLEKLVADCPGEHLALAAVDLLSPDACKAMVDAALAKFGRTDGVVHTVGGFAMAGIDEATPAQFEHLFRLNVLTTLNVFCACGPVLRRAGSGAMIAIGAGAALKSGAGMAAYAGSKAAVHRLVESFADELKPAGVRVNALLPSVIDTPQNRAAMPDTDHSTWVKPENLAATIAFLICSGGGDITGALIPISGRV